MTTITCPNCGESFTPTIKKSDEFPLVCEDFGGKCQEILPCELRNILMEVIPLIDKLENN